MYGLGTTDMKSAVAAMIFATAALQHGDVELAGDVLLVINADEERSMECGSEYLSVDYGIQADVALLGEPSGIDGPEFEFLHIVSRGLSSTPAAKNCEDGFPNTTGTWPDDSSRART